MLNIYTKSINSNKVIILYGNRPSIRCRQRSKSSDGLKVKKMKFVSYKDMEKLKLKDPGSVIGPIQFYSMSKL